MANSILLPIEQLIPTEWVKPRRVATLSQKILQEGIWTHPICIEETELFVMDGHHRLAVARKLNLKVVPVCLLNYKDIPVYSRKKRFNVSETAIKQRARLKRLYPYKTTRHFFPANHPSYAIPISLLQVEPGSGNTEYVLSHTIHLSDFAISA